MLLPSLVEGLGLVWGYLADRDFQQASGVLATYKNAQSLTILLSSAKSYILGLLYPRDSLVKGSCRTFALSGGLH